MHRLVVLNQSRRVVRATTCWTTTLFKRALSNQGGGAQARQRFPIEGTSEWLTISFDTHKVNVEVASGWSDWAEVEITPCSEGGVVPQARKEEGDRNIIITDKDLPPSDQGGGSSSSTYSYTIKARVPEKFNTSINLVNGGDVALRGKLEGTTQVYTKKGHIQAEKVRGPDIRLVTEKGDIHISKYLEGAIMARSQSFYAKMIKGSLVDLEVTEGDRPPLPTSEPHTTTTTITTTTTPPSQPPAVLQVDALYGNLTKMRCGGLTSWQKAQGLLAVSVPRSHGSLTVKANGDGDVYLGGVNGEAVVEADKGNIEASLETVEPGGHNLLQSKTGHIRLIVAPDVMALLHAETGNQEEDGLQVKPQSFRVMEQSSGKVTGELTGELEPSRAVHWGKAQRSGKIDLSGAQEQALKTFFSGSGEGRVSQSAGKGVYNNAEPQDNVVETEEEQVAEEVTCIDVRSEKGSIVVETRSWMEAIKKKFGLEHITYE